MEKKPIHRPTYIRDWRQHMGLSLDALAQKARVDKSNLSKLERGILPYNQEVLEHIAAALGTDPATLLMRGPEQPGAIWSLWDKASPAMRAQIDAIAKALVSTEKPAN